MSFRDPKKDLSVLPKAINENLKLIITTNTGNRMQRRLSVKQVPIDSKKNVLENLHGIIIFLVLRNF